ncbi:hypothetical protein FD16_GL000898 [Paucilactobacillus suebicus DSM 5007 = KCTC 3549]|uniref:DUF1934 domain-containing protein n=2 Tax=Paucilactobacillus suebicus TaxID=152335 RepID=A0A0R1W123_9LACO|nr:hypothetical protein FD16_GL000898 [Paucilactobacillus suebicus DSM 5007 = KCTC 3549]
MPVRVQLETTIEQDGQKQSFKFDEQGQLVSMNNSYYLRYSETGGQGNVPVTFKFAEDHTVVLSRDGENRLRIIFNPDNEQETHYRTAYGMMKLMVKTNRLLSDLDLITGNGKIVVDYELHGQDQLIGKYQIRLQFNG